MSETKRKLSTTEATNYVEYRPPSAFHAPVAGNGASYHQPPPPYAAQAHNTATMDAAAQATMSKELLSTAEALTQLTRSVSPMNTTPAASNIASPMSSLTIEEQGFPHELPPILPSPQQHPFVTKVNQVSRHPIVTNAFKYYESSKRAYPHFNYAAGIVERAAIPVVSKIESNLNSRHIKQMEVEHQRSQEDVSGPTRKRKRTNSTADRTETKKRLQFCLHILRLANDQINNKVNILQQKISEREMTNKSENENMILSPDDNSQDEKSELNSRSVASSPTDTAPEYNENQTQMTQNAKTEIITTVKKIIHVISNFKTSSLLSAGSPTLTPASSNEEGQELKSTIRDIILKLPSQIQQAASSSSSQQTNDRIFVFAKESLDMIGRLTKVFNDQLEKAETWIGRETPEAEDEASPIVEKKVLKVNK